MKEIDVRFEDGRDLLHAYWGYLSDGGLVIDDDSGVEPGQSIALAVHIASTGRTVSLAGTVLKRQATGGRVVIAFRPGEPHDMLLTEALAEADNVPPRRDRRFPLGVPARARAPGAEPAPARLLNMSRGGCCLEVEASPGPPQEGSAPFGVGSRVEVHADPLGARWMAGTVLWARNTERGVRFDEAAGDLLDVLRDHLAKSGDDQKGASHDPRPVPGPPALRPRCDGRLEVIAFLNDPEVVFAILDHPSLLPPSAGTSSSARAPPI